MTAQILFGDSVEQLRTLADGSVELCVTSPPYDKLRDGSYGSLSWGHFMVLAVEMTRVLCNGGIICWNVGDSVVNGSETLTSCEQKIFFHRSRGLLVHDTMIYEKTNFGHPERVRYNQLFEYVFILSKGTHESLVWGRCIWITVVCAALELIYVACH